MLGRGQVLGRRDEQDTPALGCAVYQPHGSPWEGLRVHEEGTISITPHTPMRAVPQLCLHLLSPAFL